MLSKLVGYEDRDRVCFNDKFEAVIPPNYMEQLVGALFQSNVNMNNAITKAILKKGLNIR